MASDCAPFGVYAFSNVAFSIDGRRVSGFSEGDDVIQIVPTTELGRAVVGADGSSIVSITSDQSATITLKLMMSSPFNAWLRNKEKRMRSGLVAAGALTFPVGFVDMSNGETGGCTQAILVKTPDTTRGANASEQEWQIFCPCWQPDVIEIA